MEATMDFTYLDDPFSESEDVSFENPPDGTYQARIDNLDVKENKNGKVYLGFDCIITGGTCDGKHGFPKLYIPTQDDEPDKAKNKLNMLHHGLKCLGIDPKHPQFRLSVFLQSQLSFCLDKPVWLKFKTGKDLNGNDQQQCNIIEPPKTAGTSTPTPAAGPQTVQAPPSTAAASNDPAWDPFAEE